MSLVALPSVAQLCIILTRSTISLLSHTAQRRAICVLSA